MLTFNSLKQDLCNYFGRDDDFFTNMLPSLIEKAIALIYNRGVGFTLNEQTIDTIISANIAIIPAPDDLYVVNNIALYDASNQQTYFLKSRSYEYCKKLWPYENQTDKPKYYALVVDEQQYIFIAPTPDQNYQCRLNYQPKVLLNEIVQQNFLTVNYPDLVFYAAAMKVAEFVDNQALSAKFTEKFMQELENLTTLTLKKQVDKTVTRN